jgi:O-antigen ligase
MALHTGEQTPWQDAAQDITLQEVIREPTRVLFAAFFVAFLLNAVLRKEYVISFNRTEAWMGIFSLILVTNVFLQSQRLAFSLRVTTDAFLVPFFAYYVARRFVADQWSFRQLIKILGYLGFYLIICGLLERLAHHELLYRLHGPFRSTTSYYYVITTAFFAMLLISIHVRHLRADEQYLPRVIRLFVLFLSPIIVVLIWNRGSWAGFLSGVGIFFLLGYRLIGSSLRIAAVGIVLMLAAVGLASVQLVIPEEVIEGRIAEKHTVDWRFMRWNIAISEGIQHPVFGIGVNNLRDVYGKILSNFHSTHNFFLTAFAETGILGLLAFLAVVISIIRMGWNLYRKGSCPREWWCGVTIIAVMVAHLVPALFDDAIQNGSIRLVYLYMFVGGIIGLESQRSPTHDLDEQPDDIRGRLLLSTTP